MINNELIIELYKLNIKNLISLRENMFKMNKLHRCLLCDIEAEITFLLILYFKPKNIIEFSPFNGYSTNIILQAMSINNNNSNLNSYDLVNNSINNVIVPKNTNWKLNLGDVSQKYSTWNLNEIDYLFIDSDHSKEFAINM